MEYLHLKVTCFGITCTKRMYVMHLYIYFRLHRSTFVIVVFQAAEITYCGFKGGVVLCPVGFCAASREKTGQLYFISPSLNMTIMLYFWYSPLFRLTEPHGLNFRFSENKNSVSTPPAFFKRKKKKNEANSMFSPWHTSTCRPRGRG